jgi:hypothetical protein
MNLPALFILHNIFWLTFCDFLAKDFDKLFIYELRKFRRS